MTAEHDAERPGDAISRSKRILALVDIYVDRPEHTNRTALRAALMDEFEAARADMVRELLTDGQINDLIRAQRFWSILAAESGFTLTSELHEMARSVERASLSLVTASTKKGTL